MEDFGLLLMLIAAFFFIFDDDTRKFFNNDRKREREVHEVQPETEENGNTKKEKQ